MANNRRKKGMTGVKTKNNLSATAWADIVRRDLPAMLKEDDFCIQYGDRRIDIREEIVIATIISIMSDGGQMANDFLDDSLLKANDRTKETDPFTYECEVAAELFSNGTETIISYLQLLGGAPAWTNTYRFLKKKQYKYERSVYAALTASMVITVDERSARGTCPELVDVSIFMARIIAEWVHQKNFLVIGRSAILGKTLKKTDVFMKGYGLDDWEDYKLGNMTASEFYARNEELVGKMSMSDEIAEVKGSYSYDESALQALRETPLFFCANVFSAFEEAQRTSAIVQEECRRRHDIVKKELEVVKVERARITEKNNELSKDCIAAKKEKSNYHQEVLSLKKTIRKLEAGECDECKKHENVIQELRDSTAEIRTRLHSSEKALEAATNLTESYKSALDKSEALVKSLTAIKDDENYVEPSMDIINYVLRGKRVLVIGARFNSKWFEDNLENVACFESGEFKNARMVNVKADVVILYLVGCSHSCCYKAESMFKKEAEVIVKYGGRTPKDAMIMACNALCKK